MAQRMTITAAEANDRYKKFDDAETSFLSEKDDPLTPPPGSTVVLPFSTCPQDIVASPVPVLELGKGSISKTGVSNALDNEDISKKKLVRRLVFELDESVSMSVGGLHSSLLSCHDDEEEE